MLTKSVTLRAIKSFKAKYGLERADENVIATIHLMNTHGLDAPAALDQSSVGANDHGIDAWYYDLSGRQLFVYQSKLSDNKALAFRGLEDLERAEAWLSRVIVDGELETVPDNNPCLFNLYRTLAGARENLRKIQLSLISLLNANELEDNPEYTQFERTIVRSKLNAFIRKQPSGKLLFTASEYNLEGGLPASNKIYSISRFPSAQIDLRKTAYLDLAYVTLYSLVQLYRERGDVLFEKNVRLSLVGNKDAKQRLVNPVDNTLELITSGKLSPSIFPFYHVGVTVAASSSTAEDTNVLGVEAPSIINGCQTIVIANDYLKTLERRKNEDAIERFKQVKVIAKVVVGTSNEELKEITNANNRQNPIENWQLFSNEPIHIGIEDSLKDIGIFYERQEGKFATVMTKAAVAQHYHATNGTYIRVVDLGQLIALARRNLQWAAKPSEIFLNKENHDKIFDRSIPKYARDMVFTSNLYKAMKRGLHSYLKMPNYAESNAPFIFNKAIVRAHLFFLTLLHFYQNEKRRPVRGEFSMSLTKIASPRLVDEVQSFYRNLISKIRHWYTSESNSLKIEVSGRRMEKFFDNLATEAGIDAADGPIPFTASSIDWSEYQTG